MQADASNSRAASARSGRPDRYDVRLLHVSGKADFGVVTLDLWRLQIAEDDCPIAAFSDHDTSCISTHSDMDKDRCALVGARSDLC